MYLHFVVDNLSLLELVHTWTTRKAPFSLSSIILLFPTKKLYWFVEWNSAALSFIAFWSSMLFPSILKCIHNLSYFPAIGFPTFGIVANRSSFDFFGKSASIKQDGRMLLATPSRIPEISSGPQARFKGIGTYNKIVHHFCCGFLYTVSDKTLLTFFDSFVEPTVSSHFACCQLIR